MKFKPGQFPYSVSEEYADLKDGQCCETGFPDGWRLERCNAKAKITIDGVGFCKRHANSIKKWREND